MFADEVLAALFRCLIPALPSCLAPLHAACMPCRRRYRLLEIELDAVYRSMLLLKKKKYAAIKVRTENGGVLHAPQHWRARE